MLGRGLGVDEEVDDGVEDSEGELGLYGGRCWPVCGMFDVSRLEPVKGDGLMMTIDIHRKIFVCACKDFVGTIIMQLQWLLGGIPPNKDMCAGGLGCTDISRSL